MELKLELKDISGYLPYGLWATAWEYNKKFDKNITGAVFDVCMLSESERKIMFIYLNDIRISGVNGSWSGEIGEFKAILRPLSDLYRTIIHNGKEIVPIVEIAKMARKNYDWKFTGGNICFCRNLINELQQFYFENGSFILYLEGGSYCLVNNQYQLFDYMHELKIDYRGLIDVGLAISVYDLKTNPYK